MKVTAKNRRSKHEIKDVEKIVVDSKNGEIGFKIEGIDTVLRIDICTYDEYEVER